MEEYWKPNGQLVKSICDTARDRQDESSRSPGCYLPPHDCEWYEQSGDMEGTYDTGCGDLFTVMEESPSANEFKFCIYCGGNLVEHRVDYSDL